MQKKETGVLVLGGTGHYGRCITRSLVCHGAKVRVLTRNASNARTLLGDEVEIASGDIEDLPSLEAAMHNVGRIVYAISAMAVRQIRRFKEVEQDAVIESLRVAERVGIRRVVYLSVFEVNRELAKSMRLATAGEKAFVEEYLAKSAFNWTILGAPPSMEIFFRMIRGARMLVPGGGPKGLPTVSPVDVGEIGAQTILRDDLPGERIQMVAPRAYSFPEAAERISKVWGRKIEFHKVPMAFPKFAYALSAPLSKMSDRALYIHTLLGFVRLLNKFPEYYIHRVPMIHERLLSLFSYTPSTIESEAERRKPRKP